MKGLRNLLRGPFYFLESYLFLENLGVPPAKAGGGSRSGLGFASGCHGPMPDGGVRAAPRSCAAYVPA
jgi:hypothetical protein